MNRQIAFLFLFVLLSSGCARVADLDADVAVAIYDEGVQLLASEELGEIDMTQWPRGIAALEPKSVFVSKNGLYIVTGRFFVDEWGYFVPRDASTFIAPIGEDPAFVRMSENLYKYRRAG